MSNETPGKHLHTRLQCIASFCSHEPQASEHLITPSKVGQLLEERLRISSQYFTIMLIEAIAPDSQGRWKQQTHTYILAQCISEMKAEMKAESFHL